MPPSAHLRAPPYGHTTLADLVPSLMHALGVPGFSNVLGIAPLTGVCLLVIDGLGWDLLRNHPHAAPFLTQAATDLLPLAAGFPSTTPTSLASLGTGLPPGEHGLVGFVIAVPGQDRPMNTVTWQLMGSGPVVDLRAVIVPERFQPTPTVFERAAAAGVAVSLVGPSEVAESGLTRAVLRGGHYLPSLGIGDLVAQAAAALATASRSFVYAYHGDLDTIGHRRGVASEAWRLQLGHIDQLVASLADRLPRRTALVVTADHGMVDLQPEERIDLDDEPDLLAGVRFLGGEARARYVYTDPGAAGDVLATWRTRLGDRMWVVSREEAIATGWFGPRVAQEVRPRIGDVVAVADGAVGVVRRSFDAGQARNVGHHGSITTAEQRVPCIVVRA